MAVTLSVNSTIDPATDFNDSLAGGGTGIDLGSVQNDSYAPIGVGANEGAQDIFIAHDAVDDKITDVKTFISTYADTGFTYLGRSGSNEATDLAAIIALGNASGDSKDNSNGNSGGLWLDMDADVTQTNQFDFATNGDNGATEAGNGTVVKYGDNTSTYGTDLANGIIMKAEAMVYDAPGETVAGAPVDGEIAVADSVEVGEEATVLGDNAHCRMRIYLPSSQADGGIFQVAWNIAYSFTS